MVTVSQLQDVEMCYCPSFQETTRDNIGIGAEAFLLEFPVTYYLENKIIDIMEKMGYSFTARQDVIVIFEKLELIGLSFSKSLIKTAFLSYLVFFGPIFEEFLFRECFYSITKYFQKQPADGLYQKIFRIALNGIFFGAWHLSSSQGWLNVPIFIATSIMGIVFATLRETTGNIIASSTAHSLHNSMGMILYLIARA